jgi:hypothetical protein
VKPGKVETPGTGATAAPATAEKISATGKEDRRRSMMFTEAATLA